MTFKIPKEYLDRGKVAYGEIINETSDVSDSNQDSTSNSTSFSSVNPNIVNSDFIKIPNTSKMISKYELEDHNNMNFEDTHYKLQEETGLYMPTISEFMAHFQNVVNSYKSKGKKPLFDADGNPISKKEAKDIALHLMKDHVSIYGSKGVWTWLDARFNEKSDVFYIAYDHRVHKDPQGNRSLVPQRVQALESCLMDDSYIDFSDLTNQGLPKIKSGSNYELAKNINFWHPGSGAAARFLAGPNWAGLDCNWSLSHGNWSHGVFGVSNTKK